MADTHAVARDFVELCKRGAFDEAGEKYWSQDVVSVEAAGPDPVSKGIEAARAKGEWWIENHEIHSVETHGPYVNGDQFACRFVMDITQKASGQRIQMDEVAVYTVRDGEIVEERFFYGG